LSRPERQLSPGRSALDRFGYELRRWRKECGLSQARLGALVHVSGGLVHRIEIGERRPSRDLAGHCDSVLNAGGALVHAWEDFADDAQRMREASRDIDNLAVTIDKPPEQGIALPGSEMIIVSMMSLAGEGVPVAVNRREFVTGAVSVPIVGWLGRSVPQMSQAMPDGNLDDIVRDMTSLRVILTKQDNVLGPGVAAPTVIHQLSILDALSRNSGGGARESLRRLQAAYAEFAGWLSDELGDRRAGQYWTDRALEWAHETDDELIVGYVLARKAQRAVENGDAAAAISLARAAQRRGALTERVRAAAIQYEALGHASAGESVGFSVSIDRARELIESARPAIDDDLAVWCTPGYLTMHEASGWARLNEPARAVASYQRGLADWPNEFRRDQGVYYGRLACAHAGAGTPEKAADVGRRALDIAVGTGSARILAELKPLQAALTAWRKLPLVKSFTADLGQVLSGQERQLPKQLS
jgi:transcriptional regulator with XRE-family HTH domain